MSIDSRSNMDVRRRQRASADDPLKKAGIQMRQSVLEAKVYPFEVLLPAGVAGNDVESIIMPQQVRTISKLRLLAPVGVLTDSELQEQIENRLLEHLGIEFEAESPA